MAFGFPAYATGSRRFDLPQDELASGVRNALAGLGWKFEALSPTHFVARLSAGVWSWGERVNIDVAEDGTVAVSSECVFPLQCFDWGKNQTNVHTFVDSLVRSVGKEVRAMNEQLDSTEGRSSTVLCPNCQAEIAEGSNFCHLCGIRIATPPEVAQLQPPQLPPQPPVTYVRPLKDRSMAQILEILPGLFGFLGFGWIYAGDVNTGIMFLVGYLVVAFAFVIFDVVSGGICCFFTLPLQILIIAVSVSRLNQHIKAHPELFGQ